MPVEPGASRGRSRDPLLKNTHGDAAWTPLVLLVDPDETRRFRLVHILREKGCEVFHFPSEEVALGFLPHLLGGREPDLFVLGVAALGGAASFRVRLAAVEGLPERPVFSYLAGPEEDMDVLQRRLDLQVEHLFQSRRLVGVSRTVEAGRRKMRDTLPPIRRDLSPSQTQPLPRPPGRS